ncbi:MAG TPA: protein-glutamate O-methyltransferase CheR [Vicinamibacteria bacterium]|nr:protein-glutamate O-methyltransferase CheR [Vicinamibacteria bacterium]
MALPLEKAPRPEQRAETLEDLEIRLLLEGVHEHWGFDFRDYAPASLRRRLRHFMADEDVRTVSQLQDRVLHDRAARDRLVMALTVSVTSMFRDPELYRVFRQRAVPLLRTYPLVRLWHAACATGEEVYSLAILLEEEGLYERCRIYATDINHEALRRASLGDVPLSAMRENTANYLRAGGRRTFADYYSAGTERARLDPALRRNVVFAEHNLVTDGSFNEFNVIFCRNVLIYFQKTLQERVHALLHHSLVRFGFLALGARETVEFTAFQDRYQELGQRLYRKVA